jgi:hypothetical protein
MSALRIAGIVISLLGVVATVFPQWLGFLTQATEPTADLFESVERRVRGGMVLGVGLVFVAVPALRPFSVSIPSALVWFLTGALAARLFGIAVHGAVSKQWLWVAVEAAVMVVAGLWLWKASGTAA